jgi:uncharacterized damage-inducible protein DinB
MNINLGLVEMMRYNAWANETLFEACSQLTEDQLHWRLSVTSGSTRELLVHIVGGQQTFALRTLGRQHEGELNRASAWPGMKTVTELAAATSEELISIAEHLDPESEVDLPFFGSRYRYPIRFFLIHAAEHGVEHRTEVKLNLANVGFSTPDLDGWIYGEYAGYGAEVATGR